MAMHDVCSTADDQPAEDSNASAFTNSQYAIWHGDTKPSCHTGRHKHGTHRISHTDISTAYTDSYLPLTVKPVKSFTFLNLVNGPIMLKHVVNAFIYRIFLASTHAPTVQGAAGQSARTIWLGIIRRTRYHHIAKEQAPNRVLPAECPTRLTHNIPSQLNYNY